jgi:hypothetical protein
VVFQQVFGLFAPQQQLERNRAARPKFRAIAQNPLFEATELKKGGHPARPDLLASSACGGYDIGHRGRVPNCFDMHTIGARR